MMMIFDAEAAIWAIIVRLCCGLSEKGKNYWLTSSGASYRKELPSELMIRMMIFDAEAVILRNYRDIVAWAEWKDKKLLHDL